MYQTLDSLGLIIQIRSTGDWYKRDTVSTGGHKWTLMAPLSDTSHSLFGHIRGNVTDQVNLYDSIAARQYALGFVPLDPANNLNELPDYVQARFNLGLGTVAHTNNFGDLSSLPFTLAGYGITDAVPSARRITINGVGYDLTADRSWSVTASINVLNSIVGDGSSGTPLQLDGDAATPSDGKFYGKVGGVKGWYTPSGSGTDTGLSSDHGINYRRTATAIFINADTGYGHELATNAIAQKKIDSLQALQSALIAAKFGLTDTGYTKTLASVYLLQKTIDSIKAVNASLYKLKNDSGATSSAGYVTQASRQKLSDSLQALIASSGGGFDSATSQGASSSGGFHTRNYNDARYSKGFLDSLKSHLIIDTTIIIARGASGDSILWGRNDTLFTRRMHDSSTVKHVINGDSSMTFYLDTASVDIHSTGYNKTLFVQRKDSAANQAFGYVTQASRQKLSDSLQALIAASGGGFDSATTQGASTSGGFHTRNYNDARYSKGFIDSLKAHLIIDTTVVTARGASGDSLLWGRNDTLFTRKIHDSSTVKHVINGDSSMTFYLDTAGVDIHSTGYNKTLFVQRKDSAANQAFGYVTQSSRQKLSDSLQAVLSALISAKLSKTDSVGTNAYATFDRVHKVSDSLAALFFRKTDTGYTKILPSVFTLRKVVDSLGALISGRFSRADTTGNTNVATNGHVNKVADSLSGKFASSAYLGTIYQSASLQSSDFTVNGATASFSAGVLTLSGGAGDFIKTVDLNHVTMLEKWKINGRITIGTPGTTTYGIGFGTRSINAAGQYDAVGRIDLTSNISSGQIVLSGNIFGDSTLASSSAGTISAGDVIYLTVERSFDTLRASYYNATQSVWKSASYIYNVSTVGRAQLPNTGTFSIYALGGTQTLDSLSITSLETTHADLLLLGNSKTVGYYARAYNQSFGKQLGNNIQTVVFRAGGYDHVVDMVAGLPELKALAPKRVLMVDATSNDQRDGTPSATYQANYKKISDSLLSWGTDVYYTTPAYETSIDQSGMYTYEQANFPASKIIDFWSPLATDASRYLSADGVHPTPAGHDTLYQTTLNAFKIPFVPGKGVTAGTSGSSGPISGLTTSQVPRASSASSISDGVMTDDGSGNVGINQASPSATLDINSGSVKSILHFGPSGADVGAYGIATTTGIYWAANAGFNSAWIAKAAKTSIFTAGGSDEGGFGFFTDSNNTIGSSFTPTRRANMWNSGHWTMADFGGSMADEGYLLHLNEGSVKTALRVSSSTTDDGMFHTPLATGGIISGNASYDGASWNQKGIQSSAIGMGARMGTITIYGDSNTASWTSPTPRFDFGYNGARWYGYGAGSHTGTLTYLAGYNSSGDHIEIDPSTIGGGSTTTTQSPKDSSNKLANTEYADKAVAAAVSSNIYSPTFAGATNIASVSGSGFQSSWIRVGNVVDVVITGIVSATTPGSISFTCNLPFSTTISSDASQLGVMQSSSGVNEQLVYRVNSAGSTLNVSGTAADTFSSSYTIRFRYRTQ